MAKTTPKPAAKKPEPAPIIKPETEAKPPEPEPAHDHPHPHPEPAQESDQASQEAAQAAPVPDPVSHYPPEVLEALQGRPAEGIDRTRKARHERLFEAALGVTLHERDAPVHARVQKALQVADIALVVEELYAAERGLPAVPVVPR